MIKVLAPKDSVSPDWKKQPVRTDDYQFFALQIYSLLEKADKLVMDTDADEPFQALTEAFWCQLGWEKKSGEEQILKLVHSQNKGRIWFSAYSPTQRSVLISRRELRKESFYKLLFQFLTRRPKDQPTYLILSNINEWYLIKRTDLENWLSKHPAIQAEGEKLSDENYRTWVQGIKRIIDRTASNLNITYFNVYGLRELLDQFNTKTEERVIPLLKLLHPKHLLQAPQNEKNYSSSLYHKFLSTIGVEEIKVRGRKSLKPLPSDRNLLSILNQEHDKQLMNRQESLAMAVKALGIYLGMKLWAAKWMIIHPEKVEQVADIFDSSLNLKALQQGLKNLCLRHFRKDKLSAIFWINAIDDNWYGWKHNELYQIIHSGWRLVKVNQGGFALMNDSVEMEMDVADLEEILQQLASSAIGIELMEDQQVWEYTSFVFRSLLSRRLSFSYPHTDEELIRLLKKQDPLSLAELLESITVCDPAHGSSQLLLSAASYIIWLKWRLSLIQVPPAAETPQLELEAFQLQWTISDRHPFHSVLWNEWIGLWENQLTGLDEDPLMKVVSEFSLYLKLFRYFDFQQWKDGKLHSLPDQPSFYTGNPLVSKYSLHANPQQREKLNSMQAQSVYSLKHKLEQLRRQYFEKFEAPQLLFLSGNEGEHEQRKNELKTQIVRLETQLTEADIFRNAFEWPEELREMTDEYGNWTGFDLIISRPPEKRQDKLRVYADYFKQHFKTYAYQADVSMYYVERSSQLLNEEGMLAMIVPNKWIKAQFASGFRNWLRQWRGASHEFLTSLTPYNVLNLFKKNKHWQASKFIA